MTSPPSPPSGDPVRPPSNPNPLYAPPSAGPGHPPTDPDAPRPETSGIPFRRGPANDETTVLTPVTAATHILDRIPLSERKRWRLLAGGAAGLAVLGIGFSVYLWGINNQWQTRANDLSDEAHGLSERLTETRSQVVDLQAQIDGLNDQLDTAQTRLIELADEKAQEGDAAAYAQQQIALYQELSIQGGAVATALDRCVSEMDKLVVYLKDPGSWIPSEVAAFEASVNVICDSAQGANDSFQNALTD